MPARHQHRRYDGFSRQYNPQADHAFWRPIVRVDLVHVTGEADALSADILDRQHASRIFLELADALEA
jgi:hypothetical protein